MTTVVAATRHMATASGHEATTGRSVVAAAVVTTVVTATMVATARHMATSTCNEPASGRTVVATPVVTATMVATARHMATSSGHETTTGRSVVAAVVAAVAARSSRGGDHQQRRQEGRRELHIQIDDEDSSLSPIVLMVQASDG